MLTRIISGVIGAILIITMILLNSNFPIMLNVIIVVVSALSVHEVFSAIGTTKQYNVYIPSILFALSVPVVEGSFYVQVSWYLYTLTVFGLMILFNNKTSSVKDVIVSYGITTLIVFSLRLLIDIRDSAGSYLGGFYSLVALGTAWLADTGAYFFGIFFGKHKLCKKISPKKTVEGAIGGIIFCVTFLNLIGFAFERLVFEGNVSVNYMLITFLAVIGAIISIVGDLSFSIIKRGCHIKDFGHVIPGHGGILDRFDSVIFVVPFVYIILKVVSLTF